MKLTAFKTLLPSALLFVSFIIGTGSVGATEEGPQACPPATYDLDTGIFEAPDVKVDIFGTPLHFEVRMSTAGLDPLFLQLESAIPKETGDEPGPIIVPADPDLQRLGVSKVEVLSSDISGAQFRVFAEDGGELGIVELKNEIVVESDGSAFTITTIHTFIPADGTEAVSVHFQIWMPRDMTGVKRFPRSIIFESGDRRVQISSDFVVEDDFGSTTVEHLVVESQGQFLKLNAKELADAELPDISSYREFLIETDAEFALDNSLINIAMTLPMDGSVSQYTLEQITAQIHAFSLELPKQPFHPFDAVSATVFLASNVPGDKKIFPLAFVLAACTPVIINPIFYSFCALPAVLAILSTCK